METKAAGRGVRWRGRGDGFGLVMVAVVLLASVVLLALD
jgi:hypothetical protein